MVKLCDKPHELERYQITVVKDYRRVSHICAALNVEDAKLRLEHAYSGQTLNVMEVKYLGVRRGRHATARY